MIFIFFIYIALDQRKFCILVKISVKMHKFTKIFIQNLLHPMLGAGAVCSLTETSSCQTEDQKKVEHNVYSAQITWSLISVRDAIIKENPVKSGFLPPPKFLERIFFSRSRF